MIGLAAKAPLDDLFEAVRPVGSSGIHGEIFVEFDKTREHHELNLLILLLESRNLEIGTISMETYTWWCAVRDKLVTDAAELVFVPVAEAIRLKLN